jgi:hypothetical protein
MSAYRATIKANIEGIDVDNVLGVWSSADSSPAVAGHIASALWGTWQDVADILSTAYIMSEIDVSDVNDPSIGGSFVDTYAGGRAGDILPLTVCAKVGWTTDFRGRSFRGRTGLSGILEADTVSAAPNQLTAGARTTIAGGVFSFFDTVNTALSSSVGVATALAVVSQTTGGAPRVPAIATVATGWTVYTQLGTRRSRLT